MFSDFRLQTLSNSTSIIGMHWGSHKWRVFIYEKNLIISNWDNMYIHTWFKGQLISKASFHMNQKMNGNIFCISAQASKMGQTIKMMAYYHANKWLFIILYNNLHPFFFFLLIWSKLAISQKIGRYLWTPILDGNSCKKREEAKNSRVTCCYILLSTTKTARLSPLAPFSFCCIL